MQRYICNFKMTQFCCTPRTYHIIICVLCCNHTIFTCIYINITDFVRKTFLTKATIVDDINMLPLKTGSCYDNNFIAMCGSNFLAL